MDKVLAVIHYEYTMQIRRPAVWGMVLAATVLSMLDNFPSAGNLSRLEFLKDPAYFVYRVMSLDCLILLFGLMFLLAGRFPLDRKTGMISLLIVSALRKGQYVSGKLTAGFLCTFSMVCIFLALNTMIYFLAAPFELSFLECMIPLIKAVIVSGLPSSLFVSFGSVALPAVMDLRLFYFLAAMVFGLNAAYVGSADTMPFYLMTSGDLIRLIWTHPNWPFVDLTSVLANGGFLVGGSLIFGVMLLLKRKFWRGE